MTFIAYFKKWTFKNIVWKEENEGNQHFLFHHITFFPIKDIRTQLKFCHLIKGLTAADDIPYTLYRENKLQQPFFFFS